MISFIKTILQGGFLILLPLLMFVMLLAEVIDLVIGLAPPGHHVSGRHL
jgi:hypothetical protein